MRANLALGTMENAFLVSNYARAMVAAYTCTVVLRYWLVSEAFLKLAPTYTGLAKAKLGAAQGTLKRPVLLRLKR